MAGSCDHVAWHLCSVADRQSGRPPMRSSDPMDFSGKAVVVTGGARGVGRGITRRFLEHGADVVICGRHEPDELPAVANRRASFVAADVRDPEQVAAVVKATVERHGRLDVLVNNAGGAPFAEAATASPRFSEKIIQLNLIAPLTFARGEHLSADGVDDLGALLREAVGLLSHPRSPDE